MFNYIHRRGNSKAIETAAEEKSLLGLFFLMCFTMATKQTAAKFLSVSTQGGRVRRSACQAESTPNFTYSLFVQKSLCLILFVVQSTEIRRQMHGFPNRGIQTTGVQRFYFLCPRTTYVQFLIDVETKDTPKASTASSKFSYDDESLRLALQRIWENLVCLKVHWFVNKLLFIF
jgi:hypothetical protein